ncbi:hypothetical protein SS1G_14201 [Sclerotinia sclerotiorum 1980 UF-70]|uniref:Ipa protein n=1 Tax=Sclerotinia sclerotiorum (strain ATCC 18683 / 1980 / Ss-1) TaxID=665079 RepID=A7F9C0_SCLS1|nr:hypothetical protein SS1G_14201 [Sclerotinia sclerotiorum 1980 UF-70]EDO00331.1 hypothetical protein SS1G_14201 [Sclerotinia sclerotiorum 1980 UF-70]
METDPEIVQQIKSLHADLARKYELHGSKIDQIWRGFSQNQRAEAFKAGVAENAYLKHSRDQPLGNPWKVVSELNLDDMVTEPDFLLDHLRHRATTSLLDQYREGVRDGPGDCIFILESMRDNNLRHVDDFKYCYTRFDNEDTYGRSIRSTTAAHHRDFTTELAIAFQSRAIIPQEVGELVLTRQLYILLQLNLLVADILEIGSTTKSTKPRPRKAEEAAVSALSKLSVVHNQESLSLDDMINSSFDQKTAMNDYLVLCCSESVVLHHMVNAWFFSRPEFVPDEKGRIVPVPSDKHISISIFELIHNAATGVANWDYMHRLLQLLSERPNDKVANTILLQEISNVAHLEFSRVQKVFKRYVALGTGSKYFRRVSGKYDNGFARVLLKQDPELLTRENPQLSYIFRLCSSEIDAAKSVTWIKKLDDLYRLHPAERSEVHDGILDAFGELAVIASFVQALSATVTLPPRNPRRGQLYASRLNNLLGELESLKYEVELSRFAVPMENLLEPGMTEGAIDALDQLTARRMGTNTGFLYQDLVADCVTQIQTHYEQQKDRVAQIGKKPPKTFEDPTHEASAPDILIQRRKEKHKARPADVSPYDITRDTAKSTQVEASESPLVFKVNKNTSQVFSTMFAKSEARGSVNWSAFEAAMVDLKFSVMPKFGSVYTFSPGENVGAEKSITFHRPHKSEIEGWKLIMFASRLRRVYGWNEGSFELA